MMCPSPIALALSLGAMQIWDSFSRGRLSSPALSLERDSLHSTVLYSRDREDYYKVYPLSYKMLLDQS
eukprot:scaffold8097_cov148-Skeletonema_menzelii.AAC.7